MAIGLKRAYEPPDPEDGERILVERLWPRGLKKERAALADWVKDLSPSPELRRWYGHEPARWEEFKRRYRQELAGKGGALEALAERCRRGKVTFVYAAREPERNSALVLKDYIESR